MIPYLASLVNIGLGFYVCSGCYISEVTKPYFLQVEAPICKHKKGIATNILQDVENIVPVQTSFTEMNLKTQNVAINDTLKMVSICFLTVHLPDTKCI